DRNTRSLLLFWIPAMFWVVLWVYVKRSKRTPASEPVKLAWWEKGLRWMALFLVILAVGQSAIHLVTPRLKVSPWTLAIAENFLVIPKWREDFDALKHKPYWSQ